MLNITLIIICFFILIIIFIVAWVILIKSPPSEESIPQITYTSSTYGARCSPDNVEVSSINIPYKYIPQHCAEGLICINYVNEESYKVEQGYPCSTLYRCDPSVKTCSSLQCINKTSTNLCKVKIGEKCNNITECEPSANGCIGGICVI